MFFVNLIPSHADDRFLKAIKNLREVLKMG
jgi:hypothetical protein